MRGAWWGWDRRLGAGLLAAAAGLGSVRAGAAQAADSLVRKVGPEVSVSVSAREADVSLVGTGGDRLTIRGSRELLDRLDVEQDGGRLSIRVRGSDGDLRVSLPRGTRVEANTREGKITARGLTGDVELQSFEGGFEVRGNPRRLRIEGVEGDVRVSGSPKSLRAATVSGDISVDGATGYLSLSTASGDMDVSSNGVSDGTFSAASGDITFRGRPASDGSLAFQTASGDVTIQLPRDVGATYDVTTVGGDLVTERKAQLVGGTHFGGGRRYRLKVGNGSLQVSVQAVSGTVRIGRP